MSPSGAVLPEKMQRELITPEGVDLRLQLADGGQRAGAFIIDIVILLVSLFLIGWATGALMRVVSRPVKEIVAVIWTIFVFLAMNGYFIAFELRPRAATPGKRILGIRVAARHGGRLTADAVFARNAMRLLEVWGPLMLILMGFAQAIISQGRGEPVDSWMFLLAFIWMGIFVLFPLFNRDRLRAGDLLAGTWVVRAPRQKLIADLSVDGAEHGGRFRFTREQLEAYGVKELHVLEEVLRKSDRRTMRAVAERIQRKIAWTDDPGIFDHDFLSAYYAALRQRLEQRLLFGHRRKDKFDKA